MGGIVSAVICSLFSHVNHSLAPVKSSRAARHRPERNSCEPGAASTGQAQGKLREHWTCVDFRKTSYLGIQNLMEDSVVKTLDFCPIGLNDQVCLSLFPPLTILVQPQG